MNKLARCHHATQYRDIESTISKFNLEDHVFGHAESLNIQSYLNFKHR